MEQLTPLKDIPVPGDKLTYSPLTMDFLVDENLENYREIHGWLVGLGFPTDRKEFRDLLRSGADRFPTSTGANQETDPGKVKYKATGTGAVYSDATLNILTSKNTLQILKLDFQTYFQQDYLVYNMTQQLQTFNI